MTRKVFKFSLMHATALAFVPGPKLDVWPPHESLLPRATSVSCSCLFITHASTKCARISRNVYPLSMRANDGPEIADRAIACGVYLLPLLDGFSYGAFVYQAVPGLGSAAYSLLPLVNAFHKVPSTAPPARSS